MPGSVFERRCLAFFHKSSKPTWRFYILCVTIQHPHSYTLRETVHTYWIIIFLFKFFSTQEILNDHIFRLSFRHSKSS